jgi:hypothetical protein
MADSIALWAARGIVAGIWFPGLIVGNPLAGAFLLGTGWLMAWGVGKIWPFPKAGGKT